MVLAMFGVQPEAFPHAHHRLNAGDVSARLHTENMHDNGLLVFDQTEFVK